MESTSLLKIKDESIFLEIETIAKEYAEKSLENNFLKPALLCNAIKELQNRLPDSLVNVFKTSLAGTKLGFKTDKDSKGGYDIATIKNCLIEAALNGFYWSGNEFNIIAGNFYATREGLTNKMNRSKLYSELKIKYGIPKYETAKRAILSFSATWKFNNIPYDISDELPIKINEYMTDDAIIGKANRKIRARIIEMCEGISLGDADADDIIHEIKERQNLNNTVNIKAPETKDSLFSQLISTSQIAQLRKIITQKEISEIDVNAILQDYEIDRIEEITTDDYEKLKALLSNFEVASV